MDGYGFSGCGKCILLKDVHSLISETCWVHGGSNDSGKAADSRVGKLSRVI